MLERKEQYNNDVKNALSIEEDIENILREKKILMIILNEI